MSASRHAPVTAVVTVLLALTTFTARAHAADLVYTWNSTGGNWSSAPWSGVGGSAPQTPGPGDTAEVRIFNATSPHVPITTTMDIPGLRIDKLNFQGVDITINASGGSVLGLRGRSSPSDVSPTVQSAFTGDALALPIDATGYVNVQSTGGFLTLAGAVKGPAASTVRFFGNAGTGTTVTTGSFASNSLADPGVRVAAETGTLALGNGATNQAVSGEQLIVGEGVSGAPPILRLDQPSQIADATDVFVNTPGTLNLNGRSEAVDGLTVTGTGAVEGTTSSGFLQVKGPLAMTGGTISGSADPLLELDGDITAAPSGMTSATISGKVALKGTRTFTVADGSVDQDMVINGEISDAAVGAPGGITKTGAGTLALKSTGNEYTGGTTITDGTLFTHGSGSAASYVIPPGTMTVGDGIGAPSSATLRFGRYYDSSPATALVVRSDGHVDLNFFRQWVDSLTVQDGLVDLPAQDADSLDVAGGNVAMTGGTIEGPGTMLTRTVAATSSAQGPARITSRVSPLDSSTDDLAFDVTPGVAPELEVPGALDVADTSSGGLVKTGAGTMLYSGANMLVGPTAVQGGTLVMDGSQSVPASVGAGATLAGHGTLGATTVAGTLAPSAPALHTGDLAFGPAGRLAFTPSTHVEVAGTTTIDGSAQLAPAFSGNPPAGTALPVIVNDAADAIAGRFANAAEGATFTGDASQPFTVGYAKGDGNDLSLTAGTVPTPTPTQSTPSPSPTPGAPAKDTRAPVLAFSAAKRQKLAKKGTFKVKLACDEACAVTLATTVRHRTTRRTITLSPTKVQRVKVKLPKRALKAVRKALKAKHAVKVTLSASARDAAGNVSATARRRTTLRP